MSDSTPNPTSALVFFIILTSIYSSIKYFFGKPDPNGPIISKPTTIIFIIYILILSIGQYFINLSLTNSMCGGNQWGTALLVTLIPWIIIFGLINVLLIALPGWLGPFSNTFGYLGSKLAGVNNIMNKIYEPDIKIKNPTQEQKIMMELLERISDNKSLLINEMTIQNFNEFWERTKFLMKNNSNNELKKQLFNIVRLKTIISEYVWQVLTGIFVTSVSYNYIINSKCSISEKQIQNNVDSYESEMQEDSDNLEEPRVYITDE